MPSTTCEKMSLPWSVVPNRWCHDGAWRVARMLKSVGSATEISGAITRDHDHEADEHEGRSATSGCASSSDSHPGTRRPPRLRAVTAVSGASSGSMSGLQLRHQLARTRGSRTKLSEVHDEVRRDHAEREDEQQRLRQRVVVAERGLLQRESAHRDS